MKPWFLFTLSIILSLHSFSEHDFKGVYQVGINSDDQEFEVRGDSLTMVYEYSSAETYHYQQVGDTLFCMKKDSSVYFFLWKSNRLSYSIKGLYQDKFGNGYKNDVYKTRKYFPSGYLQSTWNITSLYEYKEIKGYEQTIYYDSCATSESIKVADSKFSKIGIRQEVIAGGGSDTYIYDYYHPREIIPEWKPAGGTSFEEGDYNWEGKVLFLKKEGPDRIFGKQKRKYYRKNGTLSLVERNKNKCRSYNCLYHRDFKNQNESYGYYEGFDFFTQTPINKVSRKRGSYQVVKNDTAVLVQYYVKNKLLSSAKYQFSISLDSIPFSQNIYYDCCTGDREVVRRYYYRDSIVSYLYDGGVRGGELVKDDHIMLVHKRVMTKGEMREYTYKHEFKEPSRADNVLRDIENSVGNLSIESYRIIIFSEGFLMPKIQVDNGTAILKQGTLIFFPGDNTWWERYWYVK